MVSEINGGRVQGLLDIVGAITGAEENRFVVIGLKAILLLGLSCRTVLINTGGLRGYRLHLGGVFK
jgi:hypothetical protein